MEVTSAKALDNGRRILVDLKRKKAARYAAHFTGATRTTARRLAVDSPPKVLLKRRRTGVCKNNCGSFFKKSLLKNYSNFIKSGLPKRMLFYNNGEWADFPDGFIGLVREDFKVKKAAIEVEFKGQRVVLDFLHMIQIDLETGSQEPIAWIDEAGCCFFPELYSDADEVHDCCGDGELNGCKLLHSETNGTQEIKLQLEIQLSTADCSKIDDCIEESNARVKRPRIEEKNASNNHYELEQIHTRDVKPDIGIIEEATGENRLLDAISHSQSPILESLHMSLPIDSVQHMFLVGMGSSFSAKNVILIHRRSSMSAQARLELFQKQIEITKSYRGNANVRYAWLASSKEAVPRILLHGLGIDGLPKCSPTYGLGVHLTPADCSLVSACYCDVDENDVQHMMLCRVIMGNMELVLPGSEQFHPSSESFDSGVDDLQNPKHYTVWNVNMNTHIFPEFVVSFRMPHDEKACHLGESSVNVSGVTNSANCQKQLRPDSFLVGSVENHRLSPKHVMRTDGKDSIVGSAPRIPRSPWMPFFLLFKAIADKVSAEDMQSIYFHYDQFKRKMISRNDFVQRLRSIVGDNMLKCMILNLQDKVPKTAPGCKLAIPKQENETLNPGCKLVIPKQEIETPNPTP